MSEDEKTTIKVVALDGHTIGSMELNKNALDAFTASDGQFWSIRAENLYDDWVQARLVAEPAYPTLDTEGLKQEIRSLAVDFALEWIDYEDWDNNRKEINEDLNELTRLAMERIQGEI